MRVKIENTIQNTERAVIFLRPIYFSM